MSGPATGPQHCRSLLQYPALLYPLRAGFLVPRLQETALEQDRNRRFAPTTSYCLCWYCCSILGISKHVNNTTRGT